MSKKQTKKPAVKEPVPKLASCDDFFTQFLEKRKKYPLQKLEEIAALEESKDLKPEQVEKVKSKPAVIEKIKYFEGVLELYLEAVTKKGPVQAVQEPGMTANQLLDILAASHFMKQNKLYPEQARHEDVQTAINKIGFGLQDTDFQTKIDNMKGLVTDFAKNKKACEAVKCILETEAADAKKPKPSLFQHSSDEEEEEEEEEVTKQPPVKGIIGAGGFNLVLMPEDDAPLVEKFVKAKVTAPVKEKKKKGYKEEGADNKEGEGEKKKQDRRRKSKKEKEAEELKN